MVIAHIPYLFYGSGKPIVSLAGFALAILDQHTNEQRRSGDTTKPVEAQRDAIPSRVPRGLAIKKDIRRHDSDNISNGDLDARTESALPMSGDVIREPGERHRRSDIPTNRREEQRAVLHVATEAILAEENAIADGGKQTAEHDEAVAVPAAVREPRHDDHRDGRHRVYRDAVDLRLAGLPAELDEDGRHKEHEGVSRHSHAQVDQGSEPNLPVAEDEPVGLLVQRVHCDH